MAGSSSSSSKLPLTFGVEIEFLFGIRRGFEQYFPNHQWLGPRSFTRDDPDCHNLTDEQLTEINDPDPGEAPFPRGLAQASKILARGGGEHFVVAEDCPESFGKISKWNLTTEAAVNVPLDGPTMAIFSKDLLSQNEDPDDWDWSGLELISPVLTAPDLDSKTYRPNGTVEMKGYLNMLSPELPTNAPYVMLAGPELTSVHVHIGVRPDPSGQKDIPLDVLRHLAYLSVFFEDAITMLHHPHRRTYPDSKCREHCTPNRHVLMAEHSKDIVHTCRAGRPFDPVDAFTKIFDYKYDDERQARRHLCEVMSSKKTRKEGEITVDDILRILYVNFDNIAHAVGAFDKRTIEFRQHHGTMSGYDIEQWVVFLTALVRAAERLSSEPPKYETPSSTAVTPKLYSQINSKYHNPFKQWRALSEAAKYGDLLRQDQRSLKQFFDVLQLPRDRRAYWWNRAKALQEVFHVEWVHMSQSSCDLDCGNPTLRDCEGWNDGELGSPPWDDVDADANEAADDESVPMDIDSDTDSDDSSYPEQFALSPAPSFLYDGNYSIGEPMDIDDAAPSPQPATPHPATVNVMSITHLVNEEK